MADAAALPKYILSGADISADGKYRYLLWREWRLSAVGRKAKWRMFGVKDGAGQELGEPLSCVFIMLNPSTADAEQDDPTIRRCIGYAKAWGYDRLEVVNLFAYRATDPREVFALSQSGDPVGPRNQEVINQATGDAGMIVCAWGAHGGYMGQDETVLGWLHDKERYSLGLTKDGKPRHPLYLRADAKPKLYF